ncbi:unnamed protein product [marine sediment metagenome]|uniref:Uncharacterized protein n=1 Tax=marine sediment metagenome TaxID=412755 RepID=X1ATG8_9ZZZZ
MVEEDYTNLILGTQKDLERKKHKCKHKPKFFNELIRGKHEKE